MRIEGGGSDDRVMIGIYNAIMSRDGVHVTTVMSDMDTDVRCV